MAPDGGGKGLWWSTNFVDIGQGRRYSGQWKRIDDPINTHWEGLGMIKYGDGSVYFGMTKDNKRDGLG